MMNIDDIKKHINNKSRLIGVDMGSKRVGLSISDENRKIATPLKTINYENIQILIYELEKIINENNVHAIVFGNPKNMDGSDGPSSQSAKELAKNLSKDITKNITLWDERLSSQGAFNLSNELAINSSKKVRKLDENSAQFILQGLLDFYHKKNT